MDKLLHPLQSVEWNYLSISKPPQCNSAIDVITYAEIKVFHVSERSESSVIDIIKCQ